MIGRRVPPTYSPLTIRALVGGLVSSSRSGDSEQLLTVLRRKYHSDHVVLCDSGTSALTLALHVASDGAPTSVVALPAYGCYDLATAAIAIGAKVVLYDLDPETLGPDPISFRRALGEGPRAVVVAYIYGIPFDIATLRQQAVAAGAVLVEDAAQGFGASVGGMPCGGIGSLGVLSFGRGKGVTGGGGGALLMQDAAGDAVGRLPAGVGWSGWAKTVIQWALARPTWYGLPASIPFLRLGETVYRAPTPPRSMPGMHQEVLLRLLPAVEREAERRRSNGHQLVEKVALAPGVQPIAVSAGIAGYLRFPVLTSDRRFRSSGARRLGVMPGYPRRMADLEVLRPHIRNRNADFPGAKRLVDELVTLPTHSQLTAKDQARLASLIG